MPILLTTAATADSSPPTRAISRPRSRSSALMAPTTALMTAMSSEVATSSAPSCDVVDPGSGDDLTKGRHAIGDRDLVHSAGQVAGSLGDDRSTDCGRSGRIRRDRDAGVDSVGALGGLGFSRRRGDPCLVAKRGRGLAVGLGSRFLGRRSGGRCLRPAGGLGSGRLRRAAFAVAALAWAPSPSRPWSRLGRRGLGRRRLGLRRRACRRRWISLPSEASLGPRPLRQQVGAVPQNPAAESDGTPRQAPGPSSRRTARPRPTTSHGTSARLTYAGRGVHRGRPRSGQVADGSRPRKMGRRCGCDCRSTSTNER